MHGKITFDQVGEYIRYVHNYRKSCFLYRGRVVGVKWYPDQVIISGGCGRYESWTKVIRRWDEPKCFVYDKELTIGDISIYAD